MVNAGSYGQPGVVVPGEVVTLFGTGLGPVQPATFQLDAQGRLPTAIAGTQVLFDGAPAPLLYASATQVSAIVPYGSQGNMTQIQVSYQGNVGNCFIFPNLVASAPGIFTANASGLDQAAAFNADGAVNDADHPAAPGSAVSFYITGAGQTIPPLTDGEVATGISNLALPVTVTIGGETAQVLYAGAAPGIVAGVYQVNAVVPETLANGGPLPLTAWAGGVPTQMGVTVMVAGPPVPVPRAPETGDLRFQGVDATPHLMADPECFDFENCELRGTQTSAIVFDAVSSSLMPFGGEWRYQVFEPLLGVSPYSVSFQCDSLTDFQTQINTWTNSPTTVITSLDIEPLPPFQNQFAWSAMSSTGKFDLHYLSVAASGLDSAALAEGAASRVITAVSYDASGQVAALSYGWEQDTQTVYETMVSVTTDPANVGAAAMALAASGYIVTAFGDGGLLMVGTRVKGDTLPRPLAVTGPGSQDNMAQLLMEGYTVVGYTPDGCILEK